MTVKELIEELECFDGDLEVRFAHQPHYPFEYSVSGIWQDDEGDYTEAIYLVEGSQLGYFTQRAWD